MISRAAWRMAVKNLRRNRRRNAATGSAIALGFAALMALAGYLNRVENYLRVYTIFGTRTGHIEIYKKDGLEKASLRPLEYSLTKEDQDQIAAALGRIGNVEMAGAQLLGTGLVGNGCKTVPFLATGMDPELDRKIRVHPEVLKWDLAMREYSRGRGLWNYPDDMGPIALSEGLANLLGKHKVYDEIPEGQKTVLVTDCLAGDAKAKIGSDANVQVVAGTWSGMMSAQDGEVVAHYSTGITETNSTALYTSLTYLRRLYDTDAATFYAVWLKDPSQLDRTISSLKMALGSAGAGLAVYPWTDERISQFYQGTLQFLHVMIGFIAFVLATVIVFSISNSATMTIIERSQEIGMLRSLGYTRLTVKGLFMREMLVLCGLSLLAGGVIGGVGLAGLNAAKIHFTPPGIAGGMQLKLVPAPEMVVGAALIILVLAVTAAWLAIRRVAGQNIATLLLGSRR